MASYLVIKIPLRPGKNNDLSNERLFEASSEYDWIKPNMTVESFFEWLKLHDALYILDEQEDFPASLQ